VSVTVSGINHKRNKMKFFNVFFLLLFMMSCVSEEEAKNVNLYAGQYKVASFRSDVAVDLNNDKTSSKELTSEINSFGLGDLDIRPGEPQINDAKIISFLFPKTEISFQYNSSPEGFVQFLDYGFITAYDFTDNAFKLTESSYIEQAFIDNVESNKTVRLNGNLNVVDNTHLKLSLNKAFYDFNRKDWVMLNIEVIYERY